MKIKHSITSKICALLLVTILPVMTTGCSQAQVVKAVQNSVNLLTAVQAQVPTVKALGETLATIDPGLGEAIVEYSGVFDTASIAALRLGNAYLSAPSATGFQGFLNAVDALASQLDAQILAAGHIKNPDSQKRVLLTATAIVTSLHLAVGILKGVASSAQKNAMPAVAAVSFDQIRPYIDRELARDRLNAMGYNADRALESFGF